MKKYVLVIFLLIISITVTGCDDTTNIKNSTKEVHEHCTRHATAGAEATVNLTYEIYYKGDILNLLESTEAITSDNEEFLTEYENAYKSIHNNYEGLKYYDASVERKGNTVTNKITINYKKINIDDLISIEGEEDNIFEEKVPKASKWKELAKKLGTECEVVTN